MTERIPASSIIRVHRPAPGAANILSSSSRTRSGEDCERRAASRRISARVDSVGRSPVSARSRTALSSRIGSSANAVSRETRSAPARKSSAPPNGSTARQSSPSADESSTAIAFAVKSRRARSLSMRPSNPDTSRCESEPSPERTITRATSRPASSDTNIPPRASARDGAISCGEAAIATSRSRARTPIMASRTAPPTR